jgi:hypothetical protein
MCGHFESLPQVRYEKADALRRRMGDGCASSHHFAATPSALYGMVLLTAAIARWVPQQLIISCQGPDSTLQVDNYGGVHGVTLAV